MMNNNEKGKTSICIIGGGITGITHADILQKMNYDVTIYEQTNEIGGIWSKAYERVSLQNCNNHYYISSFPYPNKVNHHPTGPQIVQYLKDAIIKLNINVSLNHQVINAIQNKNDLSWDIEIKNLKDNKTFTKHFDKLIIAIGQFWNNDKPVTIDGEENFKGKIITERDVKDTSILKNKKVAVYGFGKSGLDIACYAAENKALNVSHIFREPRYVIPRYILGIHYSSILFTRFSTIMITCWTHPSLIENFLHTKLSSLIHFFWLGIQFLFTFIHTSHTWNADAEGKKNFQKTMPKGQTLLKNMRSAIALEPAELYYKLVGEKKIIPYHNCIEKLSGKSVILNDGSSIDDVDYLVLSCGAGKPIFPFLSIEQRELLEQENDGQQLYRHIIHPDIENLAFAGYNHGFMHIPCSEVGAIWIGALWSNDIILPTKKEMHEVIDYVLNWKRENILYETTRSNAINTRFQQYLDSMMQEFGLSPYRKLPNIFAEIFAQYGPADYVNVLDEYYAAKKKRNGKPIISNPHLLT